MIASASAELVFFAIRGALRLGQQARAAYIDATRRSEIILPLPDYDPVEDASAAFLYFASLRQDGTMLPFGLGKLVDDFLANNGLSADDERKFLDYFHEYRVQELYREGVTIGAGVTPAIPADDFNRLVTVRQWARGNEKFPTALQRFAGAFIETGVDYATSIPGIINENSREGKALIALLTGFDEIEFSEMPLGQLPSKLLGATLETVSRNADLLTSDDKLQELIRVTSRSVGLDVTARIEALRSENPAGDELVEGRLIDWAELVFRSVLSSGGRLVVENPRRFLGIEKDGQSALITYVGEALLDMALSEGATMAKVFGAEGLEKVAKAALNAVAAYPELILETGNKGLNALLSGISADLAKFDTVLTPDTLPELARLVLDRTGENLPLIWPDLKHDPAKNLLLTAATTTLDLLTAQPEDGANWSLRFDKDDLVVVVDTVFDEIVANPGWILTEAGEVSENLEVALTAAIAALRKHGDKELNAACARSIIEQAILAVSLRPEFLDNREGTERVILDIVLAMLLDAVFRGSEDVDKRSRIRWRLLRRDIIEGLVATTLEGLARVELDRSVLDQLDAVLKEQLAMIVDGQPWGLEQYNSDLKAALGLE